MQPLPNTYVDLTREYDHTHTHSFISDDDHRYCFIIIVLPHNLSPQLLEAVPAGERVDCKQCQKAVSFWKGGVSKQHKLFLSCCVYDFNIMLVKAIFNLGYVALLCIVGKWKRCILEACSWKPWHVSASSVYRVDILCELVGSTHPNTHKQALLLHIRYVCNNILHETIPYLLLGHKTKGKKEKTALWNTNVDIHAYYYEHCHSSPPTNLRKVSLQVSYCEWTFAHPAATNHTDSQSPFRQHRMPALRVLSHLYGATRSKMFVTLSSYSECRRRRARPACVWWSVSQTLVSVSKKVLALRESLDFARSRSISYTAQRKWVRQGAYAQFQPHPRWEFNFCCSSKEISQIY